MSSTSSISRKTGTIVVTRCMAIWLFFSCGSHTINQSKESFTQLSPLFDADSAYHFIQTQVDFGPRVPSLVLPSQNNMPILCFMMAV